jgi:hypothetical protein
LTLDKEDADSIASLWAGWIDVLFSRTCNAKTVSTDAEERRPTYTEEGDRPWVLPLGWQLSTPPCETLACVPKPSNTMIRQRHSHELEGNPELDQ